LGASHDSGCCFESKIEKGPMALHVPHPDHFVTSGAQVIVHHSPSGALSKPSALAVLDAVEDEFDQGFEVSATASHTARERALESGGVSVAVPDPDVPMETSNESSSCCSGQHCVLL
jgi:hypothetical protein